MVFIDLAFSTIENGRARIVLFLDLLTSFMFLDK